MTIINNIEIDNIRYERNEIKNAIVNNEPIEPKLNVIIVVSNPCLYAKRYILAREFIKRIEFVLFIHKNKKENSIIVLDNGDWHLNAYEFLRKHYYCLDYLRIEDAELTETSVFFHKRVINKSII